MLFYLYALLQLTRVGSTRAAFYAGFAAGMLIAALQLAFFWRIFSAAAVTLWAVYAFWIGLFVALARGCLVRGATSWTLWLLPFLWCGLEYFRSELYYQRFSWLSPGYAFGLAPWCAPFSVLGTYGVGFLLMLIACAALSATQRLGTKALWLLLVVTTALLAAGWLARPGIEHPGSRQLRVAGLQLEFPTEKEVMVWLNELARQHPEAELLVLSEYTLAGGPPVSLKDWCRTHHRHVIVGGKKPVSATEFDNTAFVISPDGQIVFQQVKCVPIQFFRDGRPATEQKVWNSPWGKLGICICYDLSYARVTDPLIEMGAEALIVPTMDVADWGKHQHELHARVGPVRAAEYRLPIFRLASSGISQAISALGEVTASAPCSGDAAMVTATLSLGNPGRRPLDRWLAPFSTLVAGGTILWCVIPQRWLKRKTSGAC